jgi:lipoate-protein ligase A
MAIDEAILLSADSGGALPTLRFYGWSPPAVSLGYFQDFSKEVNLKKCRSLGIDIVRRPTGGKAVLHENEVTYSVVSPKNNPLFPDTILGTYKVISSCLVQALVAMGVNASIKDSGDRQNEKSSLQSLCFSEPSRFEILVDGRKICGSAQVRAKNAFLQHGSLLVSFDAERAVQVLCPDPAPNLSDKLGNSVTAVNEYTCADQSEMLMLLKDNFRKVLNIEFRQGTLTPEEISEKLRLIKEKYSTEDWNRRGKY